MTTINTNMSANIAANVMTRNERSVSSSMERLSAGIRINSAKDDAAGLATSSKMTSQINGLNQAVRIANDAISMIQVAEGAMKEATNMFQRMRELAVQAVSDSNTSSDRTALNNEYQQLSQEVQRIAGNTQRNGTNILDGDRANTVFQIGANASQTIEVGFGTLGANITATSAATAQTGSDAAFTDVSFTGSFKVGDTIALTTDSDNQTTTAVDANAAAASNSTVTHTATTGRANDDDLTGGATPSGPLTTAGAAGDIASAAIEGVNSTRAGLGASMSRLEYASDNLQNVAQNTASARSRVMDADHPAGSYCDAVAGESVSASGTVVAAIRDRSRGLGWLQLQ